jgi:hypothetical protein
MVLRVADWSETCTYLRITGSPFCCCCWAILAVTGKYRSDWAMCAWLASRSRPGKELMLADQAYGSAARNDVVVQRRAAFAVPEQCAVTARLRAGRRQRLVWSRTAANEGPACETVSPSKGFTG